MLNIYISLIFKEYVLLKKISVLIKFLLFFPNLTIEINECFEKCLCLDEIKSNLVSKNFSLSEKIKHTIVFGFLMILFIYLYRNFDSIKPSYSGSLNEYHRISVNDNYYELRE